MAEDAADRTEAASPARLMQAHQAGDMPVAREVHVFAGLAAGILMIAWQGQAAADRLRIMLSDVLDHAADIDGRQAIASLLGELAGMAMSFILPIAAAAAVATIFAILLQTGLSLKAKALKPDFSRISPGHGLRRLIRADNLIAAAKSLVKIAAFGIVLWRVAAGRLDAIASSPLAGPAALTGTMRDLALAVAGALIGVQAAIAIADFAWTRTRFANQLKMSRGEMKEEAKQNDGDPQVKARLKQLRNARARQNLKQALAKASVVITNPSHYAVVLDYQQGQTEAPKIIAKGMDEMAARIREIARATGVPIVPSPPLARALFQLELETEIPPEHYQAVAEIIAYVWRLAGKMTREAGRL
jgi:flagellar biosynthetic protein FlhB